ncbi:Ig-like domain-containing protein, partial [Citrobacter gillenii]
MALVLRLSLPDGKSKTVKLSSRNTKHIHAQPGTHYELIDNETGKAPEGLTVKRKGQNLELEVDGKSLLEIDDFYDIANEPVYLDIHAFTGQQELVTITPATSIEGDSLVYSSAEAADGALSPLVSWSIIGTALALAAGSEAISLPFSHHNDSHDNHQSTPIKPTTPTKPSEKPAPGAIANYQDDVGGEQSRQSTATSTDDTRPAFNIGIGLTEKPKLYVDGKAVAATYDKAKGTLTPDAALTEGKHSITWTKTDKSGHESAQSTALELVVDLTAPAITTNITNYIDDSGDSSVTVNVAVTKDAMPGFKIPIGLNDMPNLYVDGKLVASTYDKTTGVLTPTTRLPDGTHAITYSLTDAAGNVSNKSMVFHVTIDTAAPNTPLPLAHYSDDIGSEKNGNSSSTVTDDLRPGFKIESGLTETIKLYVDGKLTPAKYDKTTGTLTPDVDLPEGKHTFTYTLTDAAGNVSDASSAFTLIIDHTAPGTPAAISSFNDNVGSIKDTSSNSEVTDTLRPGFNVGTGLGDTLKLYVDGKLTAATYNKTTGTLTPDVDLPEGSHQFTYTLTDAAGNESATSAVFSLIIDHTAPGVPAAIASYNDNVGSIQDVNNTSGTTDALRPGFNVGSGLNDTPNLYVDGVLVASVYDRATGTLTPVNDLTGGTHTFTYTLTDKAGNVSGESPVYSLNIDISDPAALTVQLINDTSQNRSVTSDARVMIGGLVEGATWEYTLDGGHSWQAGTGNGVSLNTTEGSHTIQVRQSDAAGRYSPVTELTFTLDQTVVAGTLLLANFDDTGSSAIDLLTQDSTFDLSLSGQDTASTVVYQVSTDGGKTWSTTTAQQSALADGKYSFRSLVRDEANNVGYSNPVNVIVDNAAPVQSAFVDSASDDGISNSDGLISNLNSSPTICIVSEPLVSVVITVNGIDYTGVTDSKGRANIVLTNANLSDGSYPVTVKVTDQAGNESVQSTYSFSVQTPPTTQATILHASDDNASGTFVGDLPSGQSTNDNTPVLMGTLTASLSAGEQVVIYDGATRLGIATVTATDWTFTSKALAIGLHSLTARVENAATGLFSASSQPVEIRVNTLTMGAISDDFGMVMGSVDQNGTTDDTTPTLSGTLGTELAAGEKIAIYDGITLLDYATVNGTTWSFTPSTALNAGAHSLSASIVDSGDNALVATAPADFTVLVTTPLTQTATIDSVTDDVGARTGALVNGESTDDGMLALAGSVSAPLTAGQVVAVYDGTSRLGEAVITGNAWTFSTPALAAGSEHKLTARVENPVTGEQSQASTDFSVIENSVKIVSGSDDVGSVTG